MNNKRYLGDGAYVEFDGNGLKLTAENGMRATDTIYLRATRMVRVGPFRRRHQGREDYR